jgi:peroxiredoxin
MDDLDMKRSLFVMLGIALVASAALGGLLFLMSRLSAPASEPTLTIEPTPAPSGAVADSATPTPTPKAASSTSNPEIATRQPTSTVETREPFSPTSVLEVRLAGRALDEPIAATVGDVPITHAAWQNATRLDEVMSHLTDQPIPSAEETLDRLINEILLLQGAGLGEATIALSEVETRVAGLEAGWGLSDEEVVAVLKEAGLDRQHLVERVARLILVERAIQAISERNPDLDTWLAQARETTDVGLYQPLEAARGTTGLESPLAETAVPTQDATPFAVALEDLPTAPQPGAFAPDFSLTTLDAQTSSLGDLRGQAVLINFWATWCPPCRAELPALQAAHERYGDRVAFLGVDVKESSDSVADFVPQFGLTFPILLDSDGAVSDRLYQVRGIPTTLFLFPDGKVSARHAGPLTEADIDHYLAPLVEATDSQPEPSPAGAGLAPDFTLDSGQGISVTLSHYRDESDVVLVFYRGQT